MNTVRKTRQANPPSPALTFEQMLPRLVAAYERGLLVPFIGAGMSVGICTSWKEFITILEREAASLNASKAPNRNSPLKSKKQEAVSSAELVRRGNHAVRRLKLVSNQAFIDAVGRALVKVPKKNKKYPIPGQTQMLAKIYWPLVLTTNYDDLFLEAWNDLNLETEMSVVGRSAEDCHRLLASLNNPRAPLMWALQGFLPGVAQYSQSTGSFWSRILPISKKGSRYFQKRYHDNILSGAEVGGLFSIVQSFLSEGDTTYSNLQEKDRFEKLRNELVVGHEEYRHVAFAQPLFRRAFAEVFRSRSFLFLGSSLNEQYFLNLFGEVLEIYGTNPNPHYALVHEKNNLDVDFLRSRYNIFVHRYNSHDMLPKLLRRFQKQLIKRSEEKSRINFTVPLANEKSALKADHLQIVSGISPGDLNPEDCICIPGHLRDNDQWTFNSKTEKILEQFGFHPKDSNTFAQESKKHLLIFDSAKTGPKRSNLTQIGQQIEEGFSLASKRGFKRIRLAWTSETHPDNNFLRFKIVEAICAYGRWIRKKQLIDPPALVLHLTDPGVFFDLRSGRIDPTELLGCEDIRFWIEIRPLKGTPIFEIYQSSKDQPLLDIARAMAVPIREDWFVETDPPPLGSIPIPFNLKKLEDDAKNNPKTLADLGVFPSVTLTFLQVPLSKSEPKHDTAKAIGSQQKTKAKASKKRSPAKPAGPKKPKIK